MRPSGRKDGCTRSTVNFGKTQGIAIKIGRTFEVSDIEDDVAKLVDMHIGIGYLSVSALSVYSAFFAFCSQYSLQRGMELGIQGHYGKNVRYFCIKEAKFI